MIIIHVSFTAKRGLFTEISVHFINLRKIKRIFEGSKRRNYSELVVEPVKNIKQLNYKSTLICKT